MQNDSSNNYASNNCSITDNLCLSPEVAHIPIKKTGIYGTLLHNRLDLPANFNKRTLKKGEIVAFKRDKITVLKWRDKNMCHF